MTVQRTPTGARIQLALHPSTDVQQVYDAFDTSPERALPGRRRARRVRRPARADPLGRGGLQVQLRADPVLLELGGLGPQDREPEPGRRSRSRARRAARAARSGDGPPCSFPPLADRAEVCLQSAALDERIYVGSLVADARRLRGRDRQAVDPAAVGARADQVARRRRPARPTCSRTSRGSGPRGSRSAGCCSTTPGSRCNGSAHLRHERGSPTRRADPRTSTRCGVRFMLWVSPLATAPTAIRAARSATPAIRCSTSATRPSSPSTSGGSGRWRSSASTASRATAADENDLGALDPALTNDYPLLFQRAVMGALPAGRRRRSSAPPPSAPRPPCPASGRATSRRSTSACSARSSPARPPR